MTIKSKVSLGKFSSSATAIFGTTTSTTARNPIRRVQVIDSENHPLWKRAGGRWDSGGGFENWKLEVDLTPARFTSRANYYPGYGWQYETQTDLAPHSVFGSLCQESFPLRTQEDHITFVGGQVTNRTSPLELYALGTKAISFLSPTNPSADLVTSLAELWAEQKFFAVPGQAGSVSGEYLNYQFGIAPTVSLAKDLRAAAEKADAIIEQYRKDAGRWIRRRYNFTPEVSSTTSRSQTYPSAVGETLGFYQCEIGDLTVTTTTTKKIWFSGAFMYTIPRGMLPSRVSELDRVYGVMPGIATGWELLPFSWLADYFTPIGAILKNADDFNQNGLVLPYAYIMATTEVVEHYVWSGSVKDKDGQPQRMALTGTIKRTHQKRIPASPFGFGVVGDLNPKQLSILAALGLSLSHK